MTNRKKVEAVTGFIFLGSRITTDSDHSHEISFFCGYRIAIRNSHQTLSNCITAKPRVDTVPGLSYAVVPDSLNWPGGSRLKVGGRLAC